MSVFTHRSYHSGRGLVEIPDERWPYFHHPDKLGADCGMLHPLSGREHASHYYQWWAQLTKKLASITANPLIEKLASITLKR